MHVYVDESLHVSSGLAVLAAVAFEPETEPLARQDLAALLPTGAKRLHWQSNGAGLRAASAALVGRHAAEVRVHLGFFDGARRGDDARERCLVRLLADVGGPPFRAITLDGRSPHQDQRDHAALAAQSLRLQLPHPPRWSHQSSLREPLLWMADAVAGAVAAQVLEGRAENVRTFADRLVIV